MKHIVRIVTKNNTHFVTGEHFQLTYYGKHSRDIFFRNIEQTCVPMNVNEQLHVGPCSLPEPSYYEQYHLNSCAVMNAAYISSKVITDTDNHSNLECFILPC